MEIDLSGFFNSSTKKFKLCLKHTIYIMCFNDLNNIVNRYVISEQYEKRMLATQTESSVLLERPLKEIYIA